MPVFVQVSVHVQARLCHGCLRELAWDAWYTVIIQVAVAHVSNSAVHFVCWQAICRTI